MCDERYHHRPRAKAWCFPFEHQDIAKMKKMAGHFMRGFLGSYIPYNIDDLGDYYLITIPLAGRIKEDVNISLINNHLNIKAGKPQIPELEKAKDKSKEEDSSDVCCAPFFSKGYTFIEVNMDIPLPVGADPDTIVSKMANGLLKITLGKKPAKKIDVNES
ncbi:MAG: Hsp20/alpha crystallin family protein [Promethearchaeota archaeon]